MDFDAWIDKAWTEHADRPAEVAARIADEGLAQVATADRVVPMAQLTRHVFGSHLARWDDAIALLDRLGRTPGLDGSSPGTAALARGVAALELASGRRDPRPALAAGDAVAVGAMAASDLLDHDAARAGALFDEAVAGTESAAFDDKDPAVRALAVAGNNIAAAIEEMPSRSEAQRALMVRAAQAGLRFWSRAGTWLETERAEYRLASSWLAAGDAAQARRHAQACVDIVRANGEVPLEAFFGYEILGRAERAAGDASRHEQAVALARAAFDRLDDGDKGWCKASLDALAAAPT